MRTGGWFACSVAAGVCLAAVFTGGPELRIARPSGLDFVQQNSPTSKKYVIETMCGGVALFDYNNDGLLDVFFVNGGHLDDSVKSPVQFSRTDPTYWNRLYRQNKDGSFTDVTEKAGLHRESDTNYGMGVATGDYDNDGFTDLYVTNYGRNVLYHNNGDGTFTDVTAKAGVAAGGWSVAAGFFDYDNDGKLDLFVTRYLDYDLANAILCTERFPVYCAPGVFPRTSNILYRNNGDGTFTDVSKKAGLSKLKGTGMGMAFGDYDDDGWPDVFVSDDGMEHRLLHNNHDGTFTDRALEAGVALSEDGKAVSGMGVDFSDYDNDGRPDIVVTDLAAEVWALYHNEGGGTFSYASSSTGLAAVCARHSGWGVGWRDFDNDGFKELFASCGHVQDTIERDRPGITYKEAPFLAKMAGGRLQPVDLPGTEPVAGRGVAFGDLNNDGAMDVVVGVLNGQPVVFHNRGRNGNHWLMLQLAGTRSNRDGFGARVKVNGQYGYCSSTGSYLSAHDKRLHFGLGSAREAKVEIRWPAGRQQVLERIKADQILTVKEP
jgi:enediyne biosynthesis protein E4